MKINSNYQVYLKGTFKNLKFKKNSTEYEYVLKNNQICFNILSSKWDSDIFKRRVGLITDFSGLINQYFDYDDFIRYFRDKLEATKFDIIFMRQDCNNFYLMNPFEECGFRCTDILNIYFIKSHDIKTTGFDKSMILDYKDCFYNELLSIASKAFTSSRFYNDFKIDNRIARKIYREYLRSKISNKNAFVKVAITDNELSGFIICENDQRINNLSYLCLIAVKDNFRGKGIGNELFKSFLYQSKEQNKCIEIGTQINNQGAISLYNKHGFSQVTSQYSMHWHRE